MILFQDDSAADIALPFNDEPIEQIVGNRERSLIIAVTSSSLYVFLPNVSFDWFLKNF